MTFWSWFVGDASAISEDGKGHYDLGEADTRAEAIEIGLRETLPGERFHIIEARSSTAAKYEFSDEVPFLRTRSHEIFVNGPRG